METIDNERLKNIHRVLFSMAQGKFDSRIPRTEEDDVIESIAVLVNMMAEEMRETLQLYSELHIQTEHQEHVHMIFILDQNFKILHVSSDVLAELGYETEDLLKESFSFLLSRNHIGLWRTIGSKILSAENYNERHKLILLNKNKIERYCSCVITTLFSTCLQTPNIMVSIYEPVKQGRMMEDAASYKTGPMFEKQRTKKPPNVLTKAKDRKILRAIYHHIIENLEKPLPHLPKLANEFGTNEFKLKYGFKQMYGTTVFRFLKDERMRKGKVLLENTSLPVKTIAEMCGYMNPSHFSKDFREAFGVTPRGVR
ncbi:MAG: helix-turn-helix domain-containing protein [Aequorivita sp.]